MHSLINSSVYLSTKVGFIMGRGECQIIRTSSFKKVNGYDESIIVGEDGNLFYRIKKIGKIVYLNNLKVYHSPRRFRKEGYFKVLFQYTREGLFLIFTGHSYLQKWNSCK
jgi:GT2 family glycosyltransferase